MGRIRFEESALNLPTPDAIVCRPNLVGSDRMQRKPEPSNLTTDLADFAFMSRYPGSIAELDLDAVQLTPQITEAVERFAAAKPYRLAALGICGLTEDRHATLRGGKSYLRFLRNESHEGGLMDHV
jgi:hypothetical protein